MVSLVYVKKIERERDRLVGERETGRERWRRERETDGREKEKSEERE